MPITPSSGSTAEQLEVRTRALMRERGWTWRRAWRQAECEIGRAKSQRTPTGSDYTAALLIGGSVSVVILGAILWGRGSPKSFIAGLGFGCVLLLVGLILRHWRTGNRTRPSVWFGTAAISIAWGVVLGVALIFALVIDQGTCNCSVELSELVTRGGYLIWLIVTLVSLAVGVTALITGVILLAAIWIRSDAPSIAAGPNGSPSSNPFTANRSN